jgi:parvulin-like peptidyl-prolyl isomerase
MAYRNRPTLDRKHRPRWQDELRTQQLTVIGFALAIAVAIGIFAAAAWSSFYDANLRQVAVVNGIPLQQADLDRRVGIIGAELTARLADLESQLGGVRDELIQQQISALQSGAGQIETTATDSLVQGAVLNDLAPTYGLSVAESRVNAEIEQRVAHPERRQLSFILVRAAVPAGEPDGTEPGRKEFAAARKEAESILAEINAGADFSTVAAEKSDDAVSKAKGGLLGWIEKDQAPYEDYYAAADGAEPGAVLGPLRSDEGWYLLRLDDWLEAGRDPNFDTLLAQSGVSDADYRGYIREELLKDEFQHYFGTDVVERFMPQRKVAQIIIKKDTGAQIPKLRLRHVLVQPLPGAEDQTKATKAQWENARRKALEIRRELLKPDADWWEIAKQSDDAANRDRGGDLGWYDPTTSNFDPAFKRGVDPLSVGDISPPVKTPFGYHIIGVTGRRSNVDDELARLMARLGDDPDAFGGLARSLSDDPTTAADFGVLGWVTKFELDAPKEAAIFGLEKAGDISDPVETDTEITIYRLLDRSDSRFLPEQQREELSSTGFSHWLEELKAEAGVWTETTTTTA